MIRFNAHRAIFLALTAAATGCSNSTPAPVPNNTSASTATANPNPASAPATGSDEKKAVDNSEKTAAPAAVNTTAAAPSPAAQDSATSKEKGKPTTNKKAVPATFTELVTAMDLRKLPVPKDATVNERKLGNYFVNMPGDLKLAAKFVRDEMQKQGCKEVPSGIPETAEYIMMNFAKGDYVATATVYPESGAQGRSTVMFSYAGNLATNKLPLPTGSTTTYTGVGQTLAECKGSVDATEKSVVEALGKEGWKAFRIEGTEPPAPHKTLRIHDFYQNGMKLSVMIAESPTDKSHSSIQFNAHLLGAELPILDKAENVEFKFTTSAVHYTIAGTVADTLKQFTTVFEKRGWKSKEEVANSGDDWAVAMFELDNDVTAINLSVNDKKQVVVRLDGLLNKVPEDPGSELQRAKELLESGDSTPSEPEPSVTLTQTETPDEDESDEAESVADAALEKELGAIEKELGDEVGGLVKDAIGQALGKTKAPVAGKKKPAPKSNRVAPPVDDSTESSSSNEAVDTESKDGFPVPTDRGSWSASKSPFRSEIELDTPASVGALVATYERDMKADGWERVVLAQNPIEATVTFEKNGGNETARIVITRDGNKSLVKAEVKNAAEAKKQGILPKDGQVALIAGSEFDESVEVTVAGKTQTLKGKAGSKKPDGPRFDTKPGKIKVTAKLANGTSFEETVEAKAGETWGVIVLEGGVLALRVY